MDLGFMGPNYSISTACATANYCFVAAANHIRKGDADIIIAGGSEAPIIPVGVGGFVACRYLDHDPPPHPPPPPRPYFKTPSLLSLLVQRDAVDKFVMMPSFSHVDKFVMIWSFLQGMCDGIVFSLVPCMHFCMV